MFDLNLHYFKYQNGATSRRPMARQDIRLRVVQLLARKRVVGGQKKQVDTVKNWFPTHEQGAVETEVREMIRDPVSPLEAYGGSRDNVRLTSLAAAKRYIEDHGRDVPWGLRDE